MSPWVQLENTVPAPQLTERLQEEADPKIPKIKLTIYCDGTCKLLISEAETGEKYPELNLLYNKS